MLVTLRAMSLHSLLKWATTQYSLETPSLQHAVSRTDDGGAPEMTASAQSYLALQPVKYLADAAEQSRRETAPDNWRRIACRLDGDGNYLTPLRCALEGIGDPDMRSFLRDLLSNVLFPSDVATAHGIPRWAQPAVMEFGLGALRRQYHTTPPVQRARPGWTSLSDSQRAAVIDGEHAA